MIQNKRALNQNAADPEQLQKAKISVQQQSKQEADDLRFVLNTLQGRRLLWKYLTEANIFHGGHVESTALLHFKNGKSSFGKRVLQDIIDANADAFVQMMTEFKEEKNINGKRKSNKRPNYSTIRRSEPELNPEERAAIEGLGLESESDNDRYDDNEITDQDGR